MDEPKPWAKVEWRGAMTPLALAIEQSLRALAPESPLVARPLAAPGVLGIGADGGSHDLIVRVVADRADLERFGAAMRVVLDVLHERAASNPGSVLVLEVVLPSGREGAVACTVGGELPVKRVQAYELQAREEVEVAELLLLLFKPAEAESWARRYYPEALRGLPITATVVDYFYAFAGVCSRYGLVDHLFFDKLQEERPRRAAEVTAVELRVGALRAASLAVA